MNLIAEIIKYILPSGVMLVAIYVMMNRFLRLEKQKLDTHLQLNRQREVFNLRLQAFERLVLLAERMAPNMLILRLNKHGMSASQLQAEMLQNIRDEFDHNLSQQLYVSAKAWSIITKAKEEMIRLSITAMGEIGQNAPSAVLASKIIEMYSGMKYNPVETAIAILKQEASELLK